MSLGPGIPAALRPLRYRQRALIATAFLQATWFDALSFSADFTTSIWLEKRAA
jgi:hypothetical protein